jgi:S-adenosylmethionine/arginine decarboxylase-like enzyme
MKHQHLIVRATVEQPPTDQILARLQLQDLVELIDMRILAGPYSEYSPLKGNQGLTVAAIIETSHIVLHTWDEQDPALVQLDVYSCKALDITKVFDWFNQYKPRTLEYKFLDREGGLREIEQSEQPRSGQR